MSTIECVCGKTFPAVNNLKQHQSYYCRGLNPDNTCKDCGKEWKSLASLNQHRRLAHTVSYNNDMKTEAHRGKIRGWTTTESAQLAKLEATYLGKHLIQYLSDTTGRTADAIRGRRKHDEYRAQLKQLKHEITTISTNTGTTQVTSPKVRTELIVHSHLETADYTTSTSIINDVDPSLIRLQDDVRKPIYNASLDNSDNLNQLRNNPINLDAGNSIKTNEHPRVTRSRSKQLDKNKDTNDNMEAENNIKEPTNTDTRMTGTYRASMKTDDTQSNQIYEYIGILCKEHPDPRLSELCGLILDNQDSQVNINTMYGYILEKISSMTKEKGTSKRSKNQPILSRAPQNKKLDTQQGGGDHQDRQKNIKTVCGHILENSYSIGGHIQEVTKRSTSNRQLDNNKKKAPKFPARTQKYRTYQILWNENKRKLADLIWSEEKPAEDNLKPPIQVIETEYKKIFEQSSIMDRAPYKKIDCGLDYSYAPITVEHIKKELNSAKSSAPGPDKITMRQMQKTEPHLWAIMYNTILASGLIPDALRGCRTTLIPKGGDLQQVGNWRPITIGSCVIRIFNKILAGRLNTLNLHHSQKGFRCIDGCLANCLLIQSIIKEHRAAAKPYNIVTIDLRKAFDSVSHESIWRALDRIGVDVRTINLVKEQYRDITTTVTCGKDHTNKISINTGVKQGDPLSPFLFNCIMDEFLSQVNHERGVQIADTHMATAAYADDLVIIGNTIHDTQHTIDQLLLFLRDRGLSVNPLKCTGLTAKRVPHKKKLFIETEAVFNSNNIAIPQVTVGQFFKYLGRNFSGTGIQQCNLPEILRGLDQIATAPLKPQQKLVMLKYYLVPRIINDLQYPSITRKTLNAIDQRIRTVIKKSLHIPAATTNHFLYAKIRDGGLGILCLKERIPVILHNRIVNLMGHEDPFTQAALTCTQGENMIRKIKKQLGNLTTKELIDRHHAQGLETSYSGNGLIQGKNNDLSSSWIDWPPRYWSSWDYTRAIQLKCNMLPTVGIPSNPIAKRKCRGGCDKTESLSHVLQQCPVTHWKRINRHDRIVTILKNIGTRNGFAVDLEPNIRSKDGTLKKPDLILKKDNDLFVCDVGIHWEGPNLLSAAYSNKVAIYSTPEFINDIKRIYKPDNITITAFIMGARGVWCPENKTIMNTLGISHHQARTITVDTLKGSCTIHKDFGTRVWDGGRHGYTRARNKS